MIRCRWTLCLAEVQCVWRDIGAANRRYSCKTASMLPHSLPKAHYPPPNLKAESSETYMHEGAKRMQASHQLVFNATPSTLKCKESVSLLGHHGFESAAAHEPVESHMRLL
eukprot:3285412-Amphidinium_carterae.2